MQPTSDEQRRDVAAGLRLLDVSDIGDDDNIVDDLEESATLFMRILEIANDYRAGLHYFPSHFVARDAVDLFAELIDRPTCFDTEDKDSKFFTCGACGFSDSQTVVNPFTLGIRCVKPSYRYCPNCGAEVVELQCFPNNMQLKKIAESDDIGGDSLQFHDAAVRDYLSFKNAMESKSQGISKAIESLIKEAEKEVVE